jgi:hypothetical protein
VPTETASISGLPDSSEDSDSDRNAKAAASEIHWPCKSKTGNTDTAAEHRTYRSGAHHNPTSRSTAMTNRPTLANVGIAPRLLKRGQAAAYCGVSIPTFTVLCPVPAIALGSGKRLERYDIRSLDGWIDTLGSRGASYGKDWLATLDGEHDGRSRERS